MYVSPGGGWMGGGVKNDKNSGKNVACKFVTEYMAPFCLIYRGKPDGGVGGRGGQGGGYTILYTYCTRTVYSTP